MAVPFLLGSSEVESHKEEGRWIILCTWKRQEKERKRCSKEKNKIAKLLSFGKNNLITRAGENDVVGLGVKPSLRTFTQEQSHTSNLSEGNFLEVTAQLGYPHFLTSNLLLGLPLRWTTSNSIYFMWRSHISFLTMALTRQSVLIDILCLVRSGNTEAVGCLLLSAAEKPDVELEKHIMNQTGCAEIGMYCLIRSFIKKYNEDNFLFYPSNLSKLLVDCYFHFIVWLCFSLMRFPTAP